MELEVRQARLRWLGHVWGGWEGAGAVYGKRDTVRETKEIYGEVRW